MENVCIKKCFECDGIENLVEHHVVPRSKGGQKTLFLCQIHHDIVHGIDPRNISLSKLVKDALQKAKANGVKLGNPYLSKARNKAAKIIQERKNQFVIQSEKIINEIRLTGIDSLSGIADSLNKRGIKSSRNSNWTATSVKRVLKHSSAINGLKAGIKSNQKNADSYSERLLPVIQEIQKANVTSLRAIAHCLNVRGFVTRTGKLFAAQSVKNILDRNLNKV